MQGGVSGLISIKLTVNQENFLILCTFSQFLLSFFELGSNFRPPPPPLTSLIPSFRNSGYLKEFVRRIRTSPDFMKRSKSNGVRPIQTLVIAFSNNGKRRNCIRRAGWITTNHANASNRFSFFFFFSFFFLPFQCTD